MSELDRCMKALEAIGNNLVQKSATYQSSKIARARAIGKATSTPEGAVLAKRIMQLHRQEVVRKMYAPVIKSVGLDREESRYDSDDEWSSMFSKADGLDDDEATEEDRLRRELRDIRDREREISERIRELHFGGR
jgi:hypothetical protein